MTPASKSETTAYEFGAYRLDADERVLMRNGLMVPLPPKVFDTLLALVENSGRVLEKEELIEMVWPDSFVEENSLNKNVSALRKVLGEGQNDQKYIETIPRRGYRFVAAVRRAEPGESIEREKKVEPNDGQKADPARRTKPYASRAVIMISASLLLLIGVATVVFLRRGDKPSPPDAPQPRSIAVLPFKDLSGKGDGSLELGMADAIITRLGGINQLVVRPTSSIASYTAAELDVLAAGRELKVESILEGRFYRQDDRIKVNVQLMNVETGAVSWASQFDENAADVFTAQDSISEQVAGALALKLTGEQKGRLKKRYTKNMAAYQEYARGRYFWNKRTPEYLKKAEGFFRKAIDLDPAYALAWAGLADCYFFQVAEAPPAKVMPRAKEAALRALELDDSLAEAHASLARVMFYYDWDWAGAEQSFKRAIELNPNYSTAHQWYAQYLMDAGRPDEAMREIGLAQQLDPLSLIIRNDAGSLLFDAGRYDEAKSVFIEVLEMEPGFARAHIELGRALEMKKMYEEAIDHYQKARSLAGDLPSISAALGYTYAAAGKRARAEAVLGELKRRAEGSYVSPYYIAMVCAGLGQREEALEWLAKAYQQRFGYMVYLRIEPRFESLRSEPQFKELLRGVGL